MYNNVGKKIQILAKILGWLLLFGGAVAWLILITNGYDSRYYGHVYERDDDLLGWLCLVGGGIGFVSSWLVYGFGQIVEDVRTIREKTEPEEIDSPKLDEKVLQEGGWKCTCGRMNAQYVFSCACGRNKPDQ